MRKPVIAYLLILLILSLPQQVAAEIYTWVDASGRVHFTDSPPADAKTEQVEISPLNTYNSPSSESIKDILARPTGITDSQGKVIVYSTTWCGVCKKAKHWLRQNKIAFSEYDTEKSERGRRDFKRMNARGVPIIKVGKQKMTGFSPSHLTQLLRKAGYKI